MLAVDPPNILVAFRVRSCHAFLVQKTPEIRDSASGARSL